MTTAGCIYLPPIAVGSGEVPKDTLDRSLTIERDFGQKSLDYRGLGIVCIQLLLQIADLSMPLLTTARWAFCRVKGGFPVLHVGIQGSRSPFRNLTDADIPTGEA